MPVRSDWGDQPSGWKRQRKGSASGRWRMRRGAKRHSRSAPATAAISGDVEDHLGIAGELQQIAGLEIHEQQPGLRIGDQVAEGVEKAVAGEIRDGEHAVHADAHESRPAAAVGDVDHSAVRRVIDIGRDEQGIRAGDHGAGSIVQPIELARGRGRRRRRVAREREIAQLDILRAVAEALLHQDLE